MMITKGARPKHKSFPGSDFDRSLADIHPKRRGRRGNEKLMPEFGQILFHHRPLIVTTALVTGYTSIVIAHVVVN